MHVWIFRIRLSHYTRFPPENDSDFVGIIRKKFRNKYRHILFQFVTYLHIFQAVQCVSFARR